LSLVVGVIDGAGNNDCDNKLDDDSDGDFENMNYVNEGVGGDDEETNMDGCASMDKVGKAVVGDNDGVAVG
jgi:hypothetical protein